MIKIADKTYLIDGLDLGLEQRTGIYVLEGDELTIIETGPSCSYEPIVKGLNELGYTLDDLLHIIVTHVHLDHAGGAGQLMQKAKNATLHVHPKGAKHLNDPTKLIQGAKVVYKDKFDDLFAPVLPCPVEHTVSHEDESVLQIAADRKLTFFHTPGHALHHFSIQDELTGAIFTGDTLGIYYGRLSQKMGTCIAIPSTSPSQFDEQSMLNSWERIKSLKPAIIGFGHFGVSTDQQEVFQSLHSSYDVFKTVLSQEHVDPTRLSHILFEALLEHFSIEDRDDDDVQMMKMDCEVSALGLIDAYHKGRIGLVS
ncbi:MBL fold metallo-hydrolase [Geomicrobium sediminis]|uniref:Glyoxylase-like metal-dependent hydrolase (Beta-lactamase superfamily II) n=1 Tax=Geomicrobium sediminis TaxID=1347788 RepID=A0ABS2PEH8_9BACL|nr:MBL fold metallo-hydrolase [Geomicrobium sediminis]MBM7633475.1 glyoxylase-like metal-dependent hydrolase (beta-lactamase superfamily II) [Geomicrobium sediminis]